MSDYQNIPISRFISVSYEVPENFGSSNYNMFSISNIWNAFVKAATLCGFTIILPVMLVVVVGFREYTTYQWAQEENGNWLFMITSVVWFFLSLIALVFVFKSFLKRREGILRTNYEDYERSRRLKSILDVFKGKTSASFQVKENKIGGKWKPYSLVRHLSQTIRASIEGTIQGFVFFGADLHVDLKTNGKIIPNIFDASIVILFTNNDGETLRAVIPSPVVTKEMFAQLMSKPISELPSGTHTRQAFDDFTYGTDLLLDPISSPKLIDQLEIACPVPYEERPEVKVYGREIVDGLVIVSALKVGDEMSVYMPSGFFNEFSNAVSKILEDKFESPDLVRAVRQCTESESF